MEEVEVGLHLRVDRAASAACAAATIGFSPVLGALGDLQSEDVHVMIDHSGTTIEG